MPIGLSSTAKSGATKPTDDAEHHRGDHGDVEIVGAVPSCGRSAPAVRRVSDGWSGVGDYRHLPGDGRRHTLAVRDVSRLRCRSPWFTRGQPRTAGAGAACPAPDRSAQPGRPALRDAGVLVAACRGRLRAVRVRHGRPGRGDARPPPGARGGPRRRRLARRSARRSGPPTRRAVLQPYAERGPRRHRRRLRHDHGPATGSAGPIPTRPRSASASSAHRAAPCAGETFTETYTGTLGPSVRVVTPVATTATDRRPGQRGHHGRADHRAGARPAAALLGGRGVAALALGRSART